MPPWSECCVANKCTHGVWEAHPQVHVLIGPPLKISLSPSSPVLYPACHTQFWRQQFGVWFHFPVNTPMLFKWIHNILIPRSSPSFFCLYYTGNGPSKNKSCTVSKLLTISKLWSIPRLNWRVLVKQRIELRTLVRCTFIGISCSYQLKMLNH